MRQQLTVDSNEAFSRRATDAKWNAVIVYDDATAGKHAIHVLHAVTHQLAGRIKLCPLLWRFDLLEDPDCRAEATADATRSGLIVIAASSKSDLPPAIKDWVEESLR